jgi:predicted phosphodiesterase
MNVQIASDLHIEYIDKPINVTDFIKPVAPVLILAGDIGSLYLFEQLEQFLIDLSKKFKYILYVPGNHEFYTMNNIKPLPFRVLINRLYQLENKIENLYLLSRSSVIINNICFIGCTLWSRIPANIMIPKYRVRIKGFNSYLYNHNNQKDIKFITDTISFCQKNNLKICVITHYPPLQKCTGLFHEKDKYKFLYYNNLDHFFKKYNIHTWIYGHVHYNQKIVQNNCQIISNQLGRTKDNVKDYSHSFIHTF